MKTMIKAIISSAALVSASMTFAGNLDSATLQYSGHSFDKHEGRILVTEDDKPQTFWEWIYSSDISPFDILPHLESEDLASASYEDRQKYFQEYQAGMKKMDSVSRYDEAEGNLIRLIGVVYPGMSKYWNDAKYHRDLRIIQTSDQIDLNRIYINKYEIGARLNEHGAFYSASVEDNATKSESYNTLERMQKGLSPLGQDGRPMVLCRLNDDPRASYFEVTKREAVRLLNALSSGMSLERACLTDEIFGDYWTARLNDIQ